MLQDFQHSEAVQFLTGLPPSASTLPNLKQDLHTTRTYALSGDKDQETWMDSAL